MAEYGSREHRTGTARHTLQPLAAEIGTPLRPSHPTCRISCKRSRHVDVPSRQDELLAVDTSACGPAKGGIRVSGKRAPTRLAQIWVLWRCAARAAGVCCAGWCGGMVEALPGTRERAREVMLESFSILVSTCTRDRPLINSRGLAFDIFVPVGPDAARPAFDNCTSEVEKDG